MPRFDVALVNAAAYPQEQVSDFLIAMRTYLVWVADFWPETVGSTLREVSHGADMTGLAPLVLAPNTTMAGSLGYHDKMRDGMPTGIVERAACDAFNWPWTIAAAHELGELLIDPTTDRMVTVAGRTFPVEIADPTTAERGHMIGNVEVANFTTPAFWGLPGPAGRYDMYATVPRPLPTIPHLGWLEWWSGSAWQNEWGAEPDPATLAYHNAHVGRRAMIRATVPV